MRTPIVRSGDNRGRALRAALALVGAGALAILVASTAAGSSSASQPPKLSATSLTASDQQQAVKSRSGRAAQTDPSLLGQTGSQLVNVLIKYDFDTPASYQGGVSGLAATSPKKTGKKLKQNTGAVAAYSSYIAGVADRTTAALEQAVPAAKVRDTLLGAYGGIAAQVPANSIADILAVDGVVAVQKDELRQPTQIDEELWTGAAAAWPSLGGQAKAGDGVIVGILDTGLWPEHPSFADPGNLSPAPPGPGPGGSYACDFGDGSDAALGPAFTCNNKLIGAHADLQTYMAVQGAGPDEFCDPATGRCSPRDSEGHGTHTSSTAAGDALDHAPLLGVDRGPISGMAPGAKLIMYRVCAAAGCFNSDSVNAVSQAIADGVDVINFSIGGGNSPYTDPVEIAFLDAFNAGIAVNASAGNDGPGAGTAAHLSPWVTTVGASTSNRFFTSTLHLASSDSSVMDKVGVTVTAGITSPTPVVLSSSFGDELCQNPFPVGSVAGKIVACLRGTNARVDKGFNVLQGGAVGMILYNPIKMDVETDNHWLPGIHVDGPNDDLVAFIANHPDVTATWASGTNTPTQGDLMASFSSRGAGGNDFIKPDITAPGVQVLAGMTPQPTGITNGPAGQLFQAIAGTSMSSPHSAGASALVKAAHPDWTPAEIKSALMTSSVQDAVKEDGVTPATPFDDGAGALRVDRALKPTLVFDESFDDYVASAADPLGRIDLNLPSIDAPTMPGQVTTWRTARNVTSIDQELSVAVDQPAGVSITVGKDNHPLHVARGASLTFPVTISAPSAANGQYFGRITLTPKNGDTPVTIPVAFVKKQGSVNLLSSCDPTTFSRKGGSAHCTVAAQNFNAGPANVTLSVSNAATGDKLDFSNVSAPASTLRKGDGLVWQGQLSPALAPRITGIEPGGLFGYLPLAAFGITAQPGFGDETIANFNVPAFKYGDEVYTRVGVDSNGYVVVGGGTTQDNDCCAPVIPNAGRPNNVLAPLWTDLFPSQGGKGAIRVATLTDGTTDWLVVEWDRVPQWGSAAAESFQVWITLGDTEGITYEYGPTTAPIAPFVVGAENRDGSSGIDTATAPASGSEATVVTTGPTAGGSVSIEFDASSTKAGTFSAIAQLVSDVTPGVTQQVTQLTVTK